MEYDFLNDPITGNAKARFSMEHEVFGPWLEVEVGHDIEKMTEVLQAIDSVGNRHTHEVLIVGNEYNALIAQDDVIVKTNSTDHDDSALTDLLDSESLDFDQNSQGSCGLEDFRMMLKSWGKFIY